jgi:hypothetical protein
MNNSPTQQQMSISPVISAASVAPAAPAVLFAASGQQLQSVASLVSPKSAQFVEPDKNVILKISAADTMHDFGIISQNRYYQDFFKSINNEYIGLGINTYRPSNVETELMKEMLIDDSLFDIVDQFEFNENKMEKNKPFIIKFSNLMKNPGFDKFIGLMASSVNKDKNPFFITDTSLLTQEIVCNIKINVAENDQPVIKQAAYLNSEATYYDKGTNLTLSHCVIYKSIEARLKKDNGNLFGLNKIKVFSINGEKYLKYYYNYNDSNNRIQSDKQTINLQREFIVNQRGMQNRNLQFFKHILIDMFTKKTITGGGPGESKKRSRKDDDVSEEPAKKKKGLLDELLYLMFKVYKLDHNLFGFYIKGKINPQKAEPFVRILFDLKRAADQLQAKSARNEGAVFVSNDRVSLCYANALKVPCIKTAAIGKSDGSSHRDRKFTFYNFDKDTVISKVLERDDYYKDILKINLDKYHKSINSLQLIQQAFHRFTQMELHNAQERINAALTKSLKMLDNGFNLLADRNPGRQSRGLDEFVLSIQPVYLFRYAHKLNVIFHIIIYNILHQIQNINNLKFKHTKYMEKYTNDTSIQNAKMLLGELNNDDFFHMIEMMEFDSQTIMYLQNVIVNYINVKPQNPTATLDSNGPTGPTGPTGPNVPHSMLFDDSNMDYDNKKGKTYNNKYFETYIESIVNLVTPVNTTVQITVLSEMINFVNSFITTIRVASKINNIMVYNKVINKNIQIFALVDNKGKMLEAANDINSAISSYENTIRKLYINTMIDVKYLPEVLGAYGGRAPIMQKNKGTRKIQIKSPKQKTEQINKNLDVLYDTPKDNAISTFTSLLNKTLQGKDDVTEMIKLLTIFFVKQFNIFDDDGTITPFGTRFFLDYTPHNLSNSQSSTHSAASKSVPQHKSAPEKLTKTKKMISPNIKGTTVRNSNSTSAT